MAIEIPTGKTVPLLDYKRVFVEEIRITQRPITNDAATPLYTLTVTIRMYAVDDDGIRHYAQDTDTLIMQDYLSVAQAKAALGDMDLLTAMGAIEAALVKILVDQRPDLAGAVQV